MLKKLLLAASLSSISNHAVAAPPEHYRDQARKLYECASADKLPFFEGYFRFEATNEVSVLIDPTRHQMKMVIFPGKKEVVFDRDGNPTNQLQQSDSDALASAIRACEQLPNDGLSKFLHSTQTAVRRDIF